MIYSLVKISFIFVAVFLIANCRSTFAESAVAPKLSETNSVPAATNAAALDGKWHRITITPSPKVPKIHTYQKFNPVWWFENSDEPRPPAWYRPGQKHRVLMWHFRNPIHNLDFYVIGIVDKKSVRSGRYPDKISNPNDGWNFAVSRRKVVLLPFFSYQRGKFAFYFGWRTQGSFGIKFNFSDTNEKQKPKSSKTKP